MGSDHGLGSNAVGPQGYSLIPVAERSVTAVSRSTLRLRPRPASAPPPSGNAGSTDYGPRGCTVGPRTCAPAHLGETEPRRNRIQTLALQAYFLKKRRNFGQYYLAKEGNSRYFSNMYIAHY